MRGPVRLHLVVHPHRRGLVDADHHRLAAIAPPEEVQHDVRGHLLQPLLARDQVVLAAELSLQLVFLRLVELRIFQQPLHVLVQVLVGQLQLGNPVLVVQRDRGPILDALREVVDADVVAEDLAGLLLVPHQRRAGEADEGRIRQRVAHVHRQRVVLAAVRLVGHHDDVRTLRQLGVALALGRAELLDQRENVAVVFGQQLLQMRAAGRLGLLLGHSTAGRERLVDLIVQLVPIGDDHEGPVAGQGPQHLLSEEQHREALARALRMPEHPEPALVLANPLHRLDRAVDPQHLVVRADLPDQPAFALLEHTKILDEVEQAVRPAGAAQHGRERDGRYLVLVLDPLPLGEMLVGGTRRADPAFSPVREDDDPVVPEQRRDRVPVVAEVLVVSVLQACMRGFQLDQHQRQAIDETHEIAPPPVHLAVYPDLRGEEEIVALALAPGDHPDRHVLLAATLVPSLDLHPVLDQAVEVLVGRHIRHCRTVAGQLLDRGVERIGGKARVEPLQCRPQTGQQDNLLVAVARQRAARAPDHIERVAHLPAELSEKLDRRPLDQRVLGETEAIRAERSTHQSAASGIGSSNMAETSISPEISLGSRRSRVVRRFWFFASSTNLRSYVGRSTSSKRSRNDSGGSTVGNP